MPAAGRQPVKVIWPEQPSNPQLRKVRNRAKIKASNKDEDKSDGVRTYENISGYRKPGRGSARDFARRGRRRYNESHAGGQGEPAVS
jgi:hypothetical protein